MARKLSEYKRRFHKRGSIQDADQPTSHFSISAPTEVKPSQFYSPADSAPWTWPAITELTTAGRACISGATGFGELAVCFRDKWASGPKGHFSGYWGLGIMDHRNNGMAQLFWG